MDFRNYLNNELQNRTKKNSNYSLRSFARDLNIEPSSLSKLLRGKRTFSKQMIIRLSDALKIKDELILDFIDSKDVNNTIALNVVEKEYKFINLEIETGAWYHFAILELMNLSFFKSDLHWIANTLDITIANVAVALKRLEMVNLIYDDNGTFKKSTNERPSSGEHFISKRDREGMVELINKAAHSVNNTDTSERIISGNIFSIDSSKLDEARNKIREFRREFSSYFSKGEKDRIYHLGVQLIPLSKSNNKE